MLRQTHRLLRARRTQRRDCQSFVAVNLFTLKWLPRVELLNVTPAVSRFASGKIIIDAGV